MTTDAVNQHHAGKQHDAAPTAQVGIVMGSDSDWPVMQDAANALKEFGIAVEVGVVSAHRMPVEMIEYGKSAHARGIKIIGDMPMFVSADSADVWSEPDIFDLDERGYPRRQAGAPGDAFAPDGH